MLKGRKFIWAFAGLALAGLAGCETGQTSRAERETESYSSTPATGVGESSYQGPSATVQGGAAYTGSTPEDVNPVARTGNGTRTGS